MKINAESFTPDILYRTFHMPLFPARTGITEAVMVKVEVTHAKQSLCMFFLFSCKLSDGHTHIVINHNVGNIFYQTEEVTMGPHEG